MEKALVPLDSIYVPPEEDKRIREKESIMKAVKERKESLLQLGQLQPILVVPLTPGEVEGKKWRLIDGQVRWLSLIELSVHHEMGTDGVREAFEHFGMEPGMIAVSSRSDEITPVRALMMEFHANEDREDFTWEEKGRYIRRIHDMLKREHEDGSGGKWTAQMTAEVIGQSTATLSHYLQLTDERDPATKDPKVKKAKTKGTALKQLKIAQNREARKRRVEKEKREEKEKKVVEEKERRAAVAKETAKLSLFHGDSREWISKVPDESLSWFHWDPPYGGKEGKGGAFSTHAGIEQEHAYFMTLLLDMLPEIHRVLFDGSWLSIWYTPVHYHFLRYALQGHRFDSEGVCEYCERHVTRDHEWLSSNYVCHSSPHRFWVNPYPNMWRKTNRVADGHEIQRFLTKETEPFLLAGKFVEKQPILLRSDRGNVFDFEGFRPHDVTRRHVHHKPPALLTEILSLISVPGALGGDAGVGSGSIFEAAGEGGRKVIGAELSDDYYDVALEVVERLYVKRNMKPTSVANWLEECFKVP